MTIETTFKSKKSTLAKSLAIFLSAGMLATTLVPVTPASAHDRRGVKHVHNHVHHHHYRKKSRRHRSSAGDVLAAGVIGLTVGALIGSAHHHRERRARRYEVVESGRIYPERRVYREHREPTRLYPEYSEPTRIYPEYDEYAGPSPRRPLTETGQPRVIRYEEPRVATLEPWSPGWYDYCKRKFRSFSAKSGTYLGYDGKRHFCVPK